VGSPRNSGLYSFLPLLRNLVDTNKDSGQSPQLKQWAVPTTVEFILFYHCYAIFLFFYTVGSSHNAKWVFSFLPRNHDSGIDSPTTIGLRPPHQKLTVVCKKCLLLPTTRPARFQPQRVYVMPPLQGFSSHKKAAPPPRLHMHHKTHMLWEKHTIWVLRCQDGWETWETWVCGRGLAREGLWWGRMLAKRFIGK